MSADVDDDDADFEDFLEMSDAEVDQEFAKAWREHDEWWATLSPTQQFAFRRMRWLELCLKWRSIIKKCDLPVFRDRLRAAQATLAGLRAERVTGIQTGAA